MVFVMCECIGVWLLLLLGRDCIEQLPGKQDHTVARLVVFSGL